MDTLLLCLLVAIQALLIAWLWLHARVLRHLHERQLQIEAATKNLAEFLAQMVLHNPKP